MKNWRDKLLAILLIAGLCLIVHVFNPTHQEAIREKKLNPQQQQSVVPTADIESAIDKYFDNPSIQQHDSVCMNIYNSEGTILGKAYNSISVGSKIVGYAGNTPILIIVDNEDVIKGVELLDNAESKGFVDKIIKAGFFNQWNGKTLAEASAMTVDAVSGATITSTAIIQNVSLLSSLVSSSNYVTAYNWVNTLKIIAVCLLIIVSIIACFNAARFAKYRIWLIAASILILGVFIGEFLSVQSFYTLLKGGLSLRYTMLILLGVAIIMPLFFSKPIYCFYLCPFGSMQELLGRITKKKIKINDNVAFYLNLAKKMYLVLIIVLALTISTIDFTDFEPFTIFIWQSASIIVITTASLILLLSLFINRPWCKYGCPTGLILSILNKGIKWKRK